MIERLQNKEVTIAQQLRSVFQLSYAVEAKLIHAIDFPPLKRPLEEYMTSSNDFFGYVKGSILVGVIEIIHTDNFTHIQSLVVDPSFFRQGIARKLMEFVLDKFDSTLFVVETGLENGPAVDLYHKFDFKEVNQWDTDHGVRKIKLERRQHN